MPAGRPLKFKSVEELEKKIDEYFKSMEKENGLPTITGLAVHLDTSRETLCNYEEKEQYFDTIKKAKSKCEFYLEAGALTNKLNSVFTIFNLKNNYGWRDKTEQETTINLPKPLLDGLRSDNSTEETTESDEAN